MAYVTGTANSITDLLSAIQAACTGNGWTLSGDVLHKGTCYAEVKINGTFIEVQGGTGVDGSDNLTGRSDVTAGRMCSDIYFDTTVPFAFPVTYDVFIGASPDEVYVHINHAVDCHQQIGWGQSSMSGLNGSGNWHAGGNGSRGNYGYCGSGIYGGSSALEVIINNYSQSCSLFAATNGQNSAVDHDLDSLTWVVRSGSTDVLASYLRQPSLWNQEAILLPVRVYASRLSGFISSVLECAHLRYVNIANVADGQIITLGSDRWMVFPFSRRGGSSGSYTIGSGWAGHAFRYDGP
ncbi:MAG TPA: hypothetical protein VFJ01_11505 [Oleiagrimonas sp.]|nr:hypothetical protein [Oleiagrimonas sp.]